MDYDPRDPLHAGMMHLQMLCPRRTDLILLCIPYLTRKPYNPQLPVDLATSLRGFSVHPYV